MNVQAPATVEARTDRLVARMAEQELDCLLVTNLLNVRYLTGFTGTNGACIVTPDERLFLTDFRYVEQAAEQVHGYERVELGRDMLRDLAGAAARPRRLRGLGRDGGQARRSSRRGWARAPSSWPPGRRWRSCAR